MPHMGGLQASRRLRSCIPIWLRTKRNGDSRTAKRCSIVLCCRTGVRAWRAGRALATRGYRNVALIALGE